MRHPITNAILCGISVIGSVCCSGSDSSSPAGTGPVATGGFIATTAMGSGGTTIAGTYPNSTTNAGLGGSSSSGGSIVTGGGNATAGTRNSSTSTQSTSVGGGLPVGGTTFGGSTSVTGGKTSGGVGNGGTSTRASSTVTGGQFTGGTSSGGKSSGGSSSGGASTSYGTGNLAPSSGALLGVFTPAQSESELQTVESQIGRKFAVHLGYFDWALDFTSFARADIAAGRIPYVTVEPWNVTLDSISSGAQDSVIQARANAVKGLNGKILLRFAHEMNGNWYKWDGYDNGGNSAAPPKYVAAYRHFHDVFTNAGVNNVLWVFCPNVDSVPNESWNQWSNYYPGDNYVDWMCFDGYNWGTDTFASMTSRIYPGLAAKNKPIMLGETSTKDAEKASWISAILPAMKNQFPLLKALVWFDVNKENDWRFDSTANSLSAFMTMAKDPYFNPK